jgi:hypothetical protein
MNMNTETQTFFCAVPPFPYKLCAREKWQLTSRWSARVMHNTATEAENIQQDLGKQ